MGFQGAGVYGMSETMVPLLAVEIYASQRILYGSMVEFSLSD